MARQAVDSDKFQKVLKRAQERFKYCEAWESYARRLFMDDIRFANADADNKYQWPTRMWNDRQRDERPALTINKTRQHNLNIINDAKMNKPGIKYRAAGNGATAESARIWDGIARHIEYQSNAPAHYDYATTFQVEAGIGYLRVNTDYVDENSFDQEIYITSIPDPLTVYMDPDAKAPAKEDMRYAFIFEDMPKDIFDQKYPQYKQYAGQELLVAEKGWMDDNHVRVAEYYEAEDIEDELLMFNGPDGQPMTLMASDLRKVDPKSSIFDDPQTRKRKVTRRVIHYHFIVGNHVVQEEEKVWIGKTIQIGRAHV